MLSSRRRLLLQKPYYEIGGVLSTNFPLYAAAAMVLWYVQQGVR